MRVDTIPAKEQNTNTNLVRSNTMKKQQITK